MEIKVSNTDSPNTVITKISAELKNYGLKLEETSSNKDETIYILKKIENKHSYDYWDQKI